MVGEIVASSIFFCSLGLINFCFFYENNLSEYDYVQEPCIIHNLSFALLFTYLALCYFILFVVLYSVFIAFCSIY